MKERQRHLIDTRNDAAAYKLAVLVPILSVLLLTSLVVPKLTVYEEHGKVSNVEVRNWGSKTTRQRPSPSHNPVTEVVGVSRTTPPARSEKLATRCSSHVVEVFRIGTVAELVLFRVGFTEDVVSDEVNADDGSSAGDAKVDRMESKVASLKTIHKGNPDEVSDGKHEPETVGGNVHGGEDGRLHEQSVSDVPKVESANEDHAVGDTAVKLNVLVAGTANVEDSPENKTGAKLVERLDVEAADARVELATNEPVVEDVARVAAESEKLALTERAEVAVDSLSKRVEQGGREETRPVLVKDGEGLRTLVEDPGRRSSHGYKEGSKGVELVVKTLTGSKLGTFKVFAGKHDPG